MLSMLVMCWVFAVTTVVKAAEKSYRVDYTITLVPDLDVAKVSIQLEDGGNFRWLDFHIDSEQFSDLEADGRLRIGGERAIWEPPNGPATLTLTAKLSHQRTSGKYDARMTSDWAIFRGDDLVPTVKVQTVKGANLNAKLHFELPEGWTNVDTGWTKEGDGSFTVDNPRRRFDRPVGWMIAGKVGTRRDIIGDTEICVGAPSGTGFRRMDVLAFLNFVWPQIELAFEKMPRKILVVGGGDPMWRGGLSAPNSLFLHADRPIVCEDSTSPLLHELTHVITHIRGKMNDDWIAEGLAEFYSIELLYRAGGMTEARYKKVRNWLTSSSRNVTTLRVANSKGPVTARAVILFQDLDRKIRHLSNGKHTIDEVTRKLMQQSKVSLHDLRRVSEQLVGVKLAVFDTPLLK
ncbi:MAG: hypothetical protein D8M57_10650 [Candidatus Scalindua sp. AMX11]|nr:MAG: hypothetical protein DWQ00_03355 [Candidatus Scalindua sp.]NOG83136.1 hypothetical protein [Planctomycetota bacterium]RZV75886.1 MAG: hypothetical protein EX341_12430 [Candidatus Scalindua sp. SCAELEC01]TDE64944.1 MAG: hypothetical protein D8M57_10650 [Candidatus Scalindua sp. AMX11]